MNQFVDVKRPLGQAMADIRKNAGYSE
jgi:hypothetical protein